MREAERLLTIPTFDTLFDELVGWDIRDTHYNNGCNYLRERLNLRGADYWRDRDIYRVQIRDLREWFELVLADGGVMCVCDSL